MGGRKWKPSPAHDSDSCREFNKPHRGEGGWCDDASSRWFSHFLPRTLSQMVVVFPKYSMGGLVVNVPSLKTFYTGSNPGNITDFFREILFNL